MRHKSIIIAVLFFCQAKLFATEKAFNGKIKAVDSAKNSITIDDVVLDVSRKTKITVDGKKATLADIKAGQQANVTYDDSLEAAITIVVGKEAEKDEEATAKVMKAIQGEWKCVADRDIDKKALKEQDRRVTIKGNSYTMKRTYGDKRGTYEGKFEIDSSNGYFDFVGKGANGELSEWIGIYELDGDKLSFCYRIKKDDKAVRPANLNSKDSILQIYKRDID